MASAAPAKCAEIGGTLQGQTCRIQESDPGYTVDISFPANYPDAEPLYDYVKQTREGFLNLATTPDARSAPYALEMKATEFHSAVPPRGTQTVVLESYEDVGGPKAPTFYKTFSWGQGSPEPITIENLFRDSAEALPTLRTLVQDEVSKQFGAVEAIPAGAGLDAENYQNFALTDDALIVFVDPGTLLPETAGAFQVSVPRAGLDALLV